MEIEYKTNDYLNNEMITKTKVSTANKQLLENRKFY